MVRRTVGSVDMTTCHPVRGVGVPQLLVPHQVTLTKTDHFKGVCHEIFDLHFFHDSTPFGPLINRLKYFRIRFRRDIGSQSDLPAWCAAHR